MFFFSKIDLFPPPQCPLILEVEICRFEEGLSLALQLMYPHSRLFQVRPFRELLSSLLDSVFFLDLDSKDLNLEMVLTGLSSSPPSFANVP